MEAEVDSGLGAALIIHILLSGLWFLVYNSQCFPENLLARTQAWRKQV